MNLGPESEIRSPFRLLLTVHSAENVPIADITTSDPFVTVVVGERLAGRTKTIHRNHKNPTWNESFKVQLLHRTSELILKLFDEDRGKDDDLLGTVTINLSEVELDMPIQGWYPVNPCGKYDTSLCKIELGLIVRSNEAVIKVIPDEMTPSNSPKENRVGDTLSAVAAENPQLGISQSVVNALTRYITNEKAVHFHEDLLRDLIWDAGSLSKSPAQSISLMKTFSKAMYNRTQLRVVNATKLILGNSKQYWHPPLPKNTIQLNLCANDSHFLSLEFSNRIAVWAATRWLLFLWEFWKISKKKQEQLPSWANTGEFSAPCVLTHSTDGKTLTGRLLLSFHKPLELRLQDESFSLKQLHNIVISSDSLVPKSYTLDIEILSFSATGEYTKEQQVLLAKEADIQKKSSVFQNVRRGIRGTIWGAATVVGGVAETAVSTGVGAARTLASGSAMHIMHTAQDSVFAVGKDLRSMLRDGAGNILSGASTYLVAKFDTVSHRVSNGGGHIYADYTLDALEDVKTLNTRRKSMRLPSTGDQEGSVVSSVYQSYERTNSDSISLLLCHGTEQQQVVIGHKRVPAPLLNQRVDTIYEVALNTQLGFGITLLSSSGLQVTAPGRMNIGAGGIFAKLKFVDRNGNSKPLGRSQEFKTPSIPAVSNPNWNSFQALFKASDSFEKAEFLRIEVCLDDLTANNILGTCFIPLALFRKKAKEYTLPMTRYKNSAVHQIDSSVVQSLGESTFRIYRVEEDSTSPAILALRATRLESNIYNTRWFAECLAYGAVLSADSQLKDTEEFSLFPAQEGLELIAVGKSLLSTAGTQADQTDAFSSPLMSGKPGAGLKFSGSSERLTETGSVGSLALTEDWNNEGPREDSAAEITVEVFENQRRQPYYPFDWSNKAYTRPLFSDITYQVAYKFDALDSAVPPQNFKWTSEWCIDKQYTATDDNGWSYGLTFGRILSNYKQNKSHTKAVKMMARRRKWVRKACPMDRNSTQSNHRNALHQFDMSNSNGKRMTYNDDDEDAGPPSDSSGLPSVSHHGSSSSPAPHTPKSPNNVSERAGAAGGTDLKLVSWRNDFLLHSPNAIVSVCQERPSSHGNVVIPWDQVHDVEVITSSILSVHVTVNRYLFDKHAHSKGFFRPADVEIFVSNCPAVELKSLIVERKWFNSFKTNIRKLIDSGDVTGLSQREKAELEKQEAEERAREGDDYVQGEALSLGSELVETLDDNSIAIEEEIRKLDAMIGTHDTVLDEAAQKEKGVLLRRDSRLRAYMAALFSVGLKGNHNFKDDEIRAIMARDYKTSQTIKHKTAVAVANSRIEFYLDTAERRIRDAVLCGWEFRGGRLERCLELFANGYFIEIVGLLGAFFEDKGVSGVKGLGSKVELINTYLKHNDRLAIIIDHALRPYALKAQPKATLSLFLDFDILVSWYTSVLLIEMRERVCDVLNVWKDRSKDVTGLSTVYKFPVPWIPLQVEAGDQYFYSCIPEDLVEILITYMQYARIHKDSIAPSFWGSIGRLDAEVLMAYTSSFVFLAEQMQNTLNGKSWAGATAEEELAEYSTWLSSVANDAHRINVQLLFAPKRVVDAAVEGEKFEQSNVEHNRKEELLSANAHKAFRGVMYNALDHLSCIVFIYIFHDCPERLADNFYTRWLEDISKAGNTASESIISSIMDDMSFFLQEKVNYLTSYCYWSLVAFAADKVLVFYLNMLKMAHRAGLIFEQREQEQMRADVKTMRNVLMTALESYSSSSASAAAHVARDSEDFLECEGKVRSKFDVLLHCCDLLESELSSNEFDNTMKKLQALAAAVPADAAVLAILIETVLGLKGVTKYTKRKQQTGSASSHGQVQARQRSSITGNSHPAPLPPLPPSSLGAPVGGRAPPQRRGSMFDYLRSAAAAATGAQTAGGNRNIDSSSHHMPSATEILAAVDKGFDGTEEGGDDDEEDEDDDDLQQEIMAKQLREQALVDCISLMIQTIRSLSSRTSDKHVSLSKYSALERVFGTDYCSTFSLEVQLLYSAAPPSHKSGSNSSYNSYYSAIKGLFSMSSSRGKTKHDVRSLQNTARATDDGEVLGYLVLSNLKVTNLFYLESLRNPHPFLRVHFGRQFATKTKVLDALTDMDMTVAEWGDEKVKIPLRSSAPISPTLEGSGRAIGTGSTTESQQPPADSAEDLIISLCYKGYFSEHVIGSIHIPVSSFAPPLLQEKSFTLADFSLTPQVAHAVTKARQEGRNLPAIVLSLSPASK